MRAIPEFELDQGPLARLVERWGGAVSTALFDPACELFRMPGVDGAIGYKRGVGGCAVALGDPVCAPDDRMTLMEGFRARFRSTVFCCATAPFARLAESAGYASLEFGAELVLDPRTDPCQGKRGRELRKKLNRAQRAGLTVEEYTRFPIEPDIEGELERVVGEWLRGRKGPQIYLAGVHLFDPPDGKRWFFARLGNQIVGLLSMMRLRSRDGWLLDHLMAVDGAPGGTTESLVCSALSVLRDEGCGYATFGPAPRAELGEIHGLGSISERLGRRAFSTVARLFHLDSRTSFRLKFGETKSEPSYILVDPPQMGWKQIYAVMRAFNVSLAL